MLGASTTKWNTTSPSRGNRSLLKKKKEQRSILCSHIFALSASKKTRKQAWSCAVWIYSLPCTVHTFSAPVSSMQDNLILPHQELLFSSPVHSCAIS